MLQITTYRLEVDMYRNNSSVFRIPSERLYQRPEIRGCWFVGAKSPEEARKILQNHLHFCKISIPKHQYIPNRYQNLKYKEIQKLQPVYTNTKSETENEIITKPRKIKHKKKKSSHQKNITVDIENYYVASECICDDTGVHYICSTCGKTHTSDIDATFCCLCE